MKKEQTLLAISVLVAGLVVWSSTGLYEPVGAAQIEKGVDVDVTDTTKADPQTGLDQNPPPGRSFLRQKRVERRKDPPKLDAPPALGFPWIRPLPWPAPAPASWSLLRDPMTAVAPPATAQPDTDTSADKPSDDEDPEVVAAREAAEERAREEKAAAERIANAAQLVQKDGKQFPCRLTPLGPDQGQPVWVILEKWPNCRFLLEELNKDGRSVVGRYEVNPAERDQYQTVHLEKTLDNEYNEERIRRRVTDGDRAANIEFATWIRTVLAPKYGVPAVRFALKHLAAAKAVQSDTALVQMIGDTCQEAYDLDEEVRTYLDYLQGARANETAVILRLADAYERAGALQAAREQYEKAAKLGDIEARVRLGSVLLRSARTDADLEAAYAEFDKGQASSARGRALAGMSAVRLRQGNVGQAVQLAADARQADPGSFEAAIASGNALYASGKFADAEQAYAAAAVLEKPVEKGGGTRARSNRAMALLALDRLGDAVNEAQACLDTDALNYLDPLVVLGEAQQRWGDLNKSNDAFQTALQRSPRNAWVLLRLASIRLRDGLPRQAMDLVQGTDGILGLLQIAPQSVDALQVAGLVCAAQDTPDWPGAAKYLRRALDKEPKNLDLVYDLAKVLQMGDRSDEAIALLEKVTEPNAGVAKNDGRVLSLLAWIYFDGQKAPVDKVYETIDRARRATPGAWTKKYVEDMYQAVHTWDLTRIWEDNFESTGRNTLGNGWVERESLGVQIGLDGHNAVFSLKAHPAPSRNAWTGIERNEDLMPLEEVTAVLKPETGYDFVVHLFKEGVPEFDSAGGGGGAGGRRGPKNVSELGLGADRAGRMMLYVYSGGGTKLFNVPIKNADGTDRAWPYDGSYHRVTFRRVGELNKGGFEILLDGEKVPTETPIEVSALSAQFNKAATFGIHIDADEGTTVNLYVDSVQIERILGPRK